MALRAALLALAKGIEAPALPLPSLTAIAADQPWPPGFAAALGWVAAGPVLLRLDVAERLAADLQRAGRRGQAPLPPGLASRLSLRAEMLPAVLRGLGFRLVPAAALDATAYGPPAPPMITWRPPPRPRSQAETPLTASTGPFASLAALRRHGGGA
jgi:ATP-dependent RNA helicase SUPV3L1/SUV3